MDNYIKSATNYAINSKTRDLKDFDRLVEIAETVCVCCNHSCPILK